MEDLEEILDLIEACKVNVNREEVLDYLVNEIGHKKEFLEVKGGKEEYTDLHHDIRNLLIDLYAHAVKSYYRYDDNLQLNIDREKGLLYLNKV